ncbi:hypothetical protein G6F46_005978 [Rhizopus delemar]|uniref:CRAL-TRIO domain-containing protein n=3 Tax=Rhizopus TaxID=4842 RepID=I1CRE7_RHIO9|nr:hypothetical protein RO3G_15738 [Rhizopus delemar RA 99-880]KAG1458599.1 hypothetical protein G6F55_005246 [Rhizopus delemar]KAG1544447.1 hypothetical protein G6F51_006051 [Rhizopus arrhizus]KAG1498138.1 hypothetical protein G6F54_005288 [Rhizopus delemar]KAG1511915.1 hypothetical protein G6F53_005579 [Rhizopus delemar]|eukprot:EIE91027.1 hypothetical protein RO3G_15738 [Rhizopus delemar RA 99-880]
MSQVIYPKELSLANRKEGHAGALNEEQLDKLKKLWLRVLALFQQQGETVQLEQEPTKKKTGGLFGFGKKEEKEKEYFLGTTSDPRWRNLSLDKALPLIPGSLLHQAFWGLVATDNPDSTLLRFLRARKWDLDASFNMLANTLRWRIDMRTNDIVALGETGLIEELERSKSGLGTSFKELLGRKMVTLGGPDKNDRGICFINVQVYHKEDQPIETIKLLTIYIMETARIICDYPMETVCIVFNLENFTMANMDLDAVKFLAECFQAYYPESLGLACVHKAPWVFSTIWNLITPLLDPVVASKIIFTKSVQDLQNHIPEDSLPSLITGDASKPSFDERTVSEPPRPGRISIPADDADVKSYWKNVLDYEKKTTEWAESNQESLLERLKLGQSYRISRVKAEKLIRGETSYHAKGMININKDDRLIVSYKTSSWDSKDITDWV